jgi:hypothetical protein
LLLELSSADGIVGGEDLLLKAGQVLIELERPLVLGLQLLGEGVVGHVLALERG